MTDFHVRDARPADAEAIASIYNVHVRGTIVTFERQEVPVSEMARRVVDVQARGLPWLVAEQAGAPVGYAYAAPWKPRAAYAHTVESSIYLAEPARGRGYGTRLYRELLERLRTLGLHAVIGGAALPNPASAALHAGLGFVPAGVFREVGFKFGRWIDVAYWQLRWPPAPGGEQ